MKNKLTFYSLSFPLWFILLIPISWILLIPLSFALDSLLIYLGFLIIGLDNKKVRFKKIIVKAWIFGLIGDLTGYLLLFIIMPLSSATIGNNPNSILHEIANGIMSNPFDYLSSFIWVLISYAAGVGVSCFLHKKFTFKNVDIELKDRKILIIVLAILSGPYLAFFG